MGGAAGSGLLASDAAAQASRGEYRGGHSSSTRTDTPPEPARVSIVAFPGGKIFLDDKPIGRDATGTLVLKPGRYVIRVENRFVGQYSESVKIREGQTGAITITW
ncbi:MAG: hypothetical protein ACTHU0_24225 [Kofleriaceae bacterium]